VIYPENFEDKIGFTRIRELVKKKCSSVLGSLHVEEMAFDTRYDVLMKSLKQVDEFQRILRFEQDFSLGPVPDIREALDKIKVEGRHLDTDELKALRVSLDTARVVVNFFTRKEAEDYPVTRELVGSVKMYPYLSERIEKVLNKQGKIRDNASKELQVIRRGITQKQSAAVKIMNRLLQQAQSEGFADKDAAASLRNGRPVIPVDASSKRRVKGIIHDQSASGKTIFIEPTEVVEINNEIRELEYEENREIIKILTLLTDDFRPYYDEMVSLGEFLGIIDFMMAKAGFANDIQAVLPSITDSKQINWERAVHPLLYLAYRKESKKVVPLDIMLSEEKRILIISGPNAGGKSVCLKTVGLLQYMLQCGLLIPVKEDSQAGIFESIFIDIGDEQSIENDLSTYSSHLKNMNFFIRKGDPSTLLLIDEFGTGTEPLLGGAIAEAVLEQINSSGCYGVITTHYSNLKHYAATAEGIENAAMMFDSHEMKPLFKLVIGQPGSSFAFEIARSIGLYEDVIKSATDKIGAEHRNFDQHLKEIIRDKKYWESKRDKIRKSEKRLQEVLAEYAKELELTQQNRKKILGEAKKQAEDLLSGTNKKIENTILQIRESQAEREKTRKLREELKAHKEVVEKSLKDTGSETVKKISAVKTEEEKIKERRKRFGQLEQTRTVKKKLLDPTIRTGDYVLLKGQETPGEVVNVSGNKAKVNFGYLSSTVEVSKLDKIDPEQYQKSVQKTSAKGDFADWDVSLKKLQFRPEIDLRGQRVDEALRSVSEYIDEAVMVDARSVRILHGKGDGILRMAIREYLNTLDFVGSFKDEHVQLGGAGITVVTLDI